MANGKKDKRRDDALTVAKTGLSLTGHSAIAAALQMAGLAAGRFRERRIQLMWKHVVTGMEEPLVFTRRIEEALLEDGEAVSEGFVAAAQAAADAITPVAVASIGLAARAFLTEQRVPRRLYRAVLALLRSLDAAEYGALRTAMHALAAHGVGAALTVLRATDEGPRWECLRDDGPPLVLATGEIATVLVGALGPPMATVPPFAEHTADPLIASRLHVHLPFAKLMAEVMPVEPGPAR
jgi:hypothetical protein